MNAVRTTGEQLIELWILLCGGKEMINLFETCSYVVGS